MKITLYPVTTKEVLFYRTDSGLLIQFQAQSGDKCLIELSDDMVYYFIQNLAHYLWDMTLEEAFFNDTGRPENSLPRDF